MTETIRCPVCGKRVLSDVEYCPNCSNPLKSSGVDEEKHAAVRKQVLGRSLTNAFIFGILFVIVWEIVSRFVAEGWPMVVVNIVAFLLSLWIFLWPLYSYLKTAIPPVLSALFSVISWVVLFVGLRSLVRFLF